jgi:hypothetical protein
MIQNLQLIFAPSKYALSFRKSPPSAISAQSSAASPPPSAIGRRPSFRFSPSAFHFSSGFRFSTSAFQLFTLPLFYLLAHRAPPPTCPVESCNFMPPGPAISYQLSAIGRRPSFHFPTSAFLLHLLNHSPRIFLPRILNLIFSPIRLKLKLAFSRSGTWKKFRCPS